MKQPVEIDSINPLSSWFSDQNSLSVEDQLIKVIFDSIVPKENQGDYLTSSLSGIPDPSLAEGVSEGIGVLIDAIIANKEILIIGDYDVDGITSTVLLIRFFQKIDFHNYGYFIPNRFTHGYGLTDKTVDEIIQKGPDLVITVDNGITARREIQRIKDAGINVVITDHHLPQDGEIPDCVIINPKQACCQFPFKELAGVGVVFIVLIALRTEMRNRGFWLGKKEPNLLEHLDLVAIGTIADQVPLIGVNRVFAKHGLDQMTKRAHDGHPEKFYLYLKVFADKNRLKSFDSNSITFKLAPMLNAAGRMKDAELGVSFLLSDTEQNAISRYSVIERLNVQRRKTQKIMVSKAMKKARAQSQDEQGLVIYDSSFHEGLIGIVASRIVEKFNAPCVVATDAENDLIKASCRSRTENIMEMLQECEAYLVRFGGHANAAGCSMEKKNLERFHQQFTEVYSTFKTKGKSKTYHADIEVKLDMLSFDLLDKMRVFEPFGQENRKPVFMVRNQQLSIPAVLTGKHLKWGLQRDLEVIHWNGEIDAEYGRAFDIAFTLSENTYRGERKRQLIIAAIAPSVTN